MVDRQTRQGRHLVEDLGRGVRLEMVELPGGEFLMGDTEQHSVRVSPFFIGKYPVTQVQWRSVMGSLPVGLSGNDHPVVKISWEEASEFCRRLSQKTNHQYRLPTEAEWEYACRAGTTTPFAFGPTVTPEIVNYDGNYPYGKAPKGEYRGKTIPVGSLGAANAFGLYDMHGNVWEWCSDWYGGNYEECRKQGVVTDPQGPAAGSVRVIRGGGWNGNAVVCRSAVRHYWAPGFRSVIVGFRLVRIGR